MAAARDPSTQSTATANPNDKAGIQAWIGLAVLALPTLLVAIDMTVLHLAIPAITAVLAPSSTQMLWIVDIYGFMIAGLLVSMGALGDRIGRRRLLMIGAAGFCAASLLAAFAPSAEMLIGARALLGITAATLMPSTLSLISNMFRNDAQRGVAIAIWTSMFMAGTAAGPLLGGVMLEHFWWGSVFLLNVPLTLLLIAVAPFLLPEYRAPQQGRIDIASILLLLAGMLSFVYGIKHVVSHGKDVLTWISMAAGAALLFVFVRRQLRLADPMFAVTLFRLPAFSASLTIQLFAVFAIGAPYFFGAQYLQLVLGLPPLQAGLSMLPATLAGIVGSVTAPRIAVLMRPAYVIALMLLLGALGLAVMMLIGGEQDLLVLIAGLSLTMLGASGATTLTIGLIVGSVPPERAGEASGMSETSGELGMALSIAIMGSLSIAVYRAQLAGALPADLPPQLASAAMESLGALTAALTHADHIVSPAVVMAANAAFADGLFAVTLGGFLLMLLLVGVALKFLRRERLA